MEKAYVWFGLLLCIKSSVVYSQTVLNIMQIYSDYIGAAYTTSKSSIDFAVEVINNASLLPDYTIVNFGAPVDVS